MTSPSFHTITTHEELDAFAAEGTKPLQAEVEAAGEQLRRIEQLNAPAVEALRAVAADAQAAEGNMAFDAFERRPLLSAIDDVGARLAARAAAQRDRVRAAKQKLAQFKEGVEAQRARLTREEEERQQAAEADVRRLLTALHSLGGNIQLPPPPKKAPRAAGKPQLEVVVGGEQTSLENS